MTASKNKIDYNNEYNKLNYKHIHIAVRENKFIEIKNAAKNHGMSTNAFVLSCVEKEMNKDEDNRI